jgi:hypothetical protein
MIQLTLFLDRETVDERIACDPPSGFSSPYRISVENKAKEILRDTTPSPLTVYFDPES